MEVGKPPLLPGPSKFSVYPKTTWRHPWISSLSVFTVLGLLLAIVILSIELPHSNADTKRILPKIDFSHPESKTQVDEFRDSLLQPPQTSINSAVVEPSNGNEADSVVFFVHGLGGYIDTQVADALGPYFPNTRW